MPPTTNSRGARFELGAVHPFDEQDGGIKAADRMAFDEPSVTYPRLRARGAALYQRGNTILEYRVVHRGRKRRLDMCIGRGERRSAAGANSGGRASAAMQVSISATGRHAGSGAGAVPSQSIIIGIILFIKTTTPIGDVTISVSGKKRGTPSVARSKPTTEHPNVTASCNDHEFTNGIRNGEGDAGRRP
jgi:hypothetical protein